MTLFRKAYEDSHAFRNIVITLIVICLFVGVACIRFYNQVGQTVKDESEHYLREITNRMNSNIERTIKDNYAILSTMKTVLEKEDERTFDEIGSFLHLQEQHWDFNKALLIDEAGVAYDCNGDEVSITGDSFLRSLSKDKNTIAPAQVINNEETLIFATPITQVYVEGRQIVALATCYDPDEFDRTLSMTSFNNQAYSYIVDKKGKSVIRSSSQYATKFGYNILHTIRDEDLSSQSKIDELLKKMKNNENGQDEFEIGDSQEYLVYTKINLEDDWYLFTFVPVKAVNEKSSMLLQSTLMISGLIFIVFALFLLIIVSSFRRNRQRLEQIAYVDSLTGGNTIQRFRELANARLEEEDKFAIIYINVQRFKVLNDQFGRDVCDQIIMCIHEGLIVSLNKGEYIGHMSADNFIVLVNYTNKEDMKDRIYHWDVQMEKSAHEIMQSFPLFTIEYGIYEVESKQIDLEDMMDGARIALREHVLVHPLSDYIHYSFYDDTTRAKMLKEKHLEDMMDKSLKENEFQMYLQPKYAVQTSKIGGAEALVRWQSKENGMIYPDEFITLFEKNGFIIKLDLWMFEQVCMTLQKWIDQGKRPVRISVNCSRAHLKDSNFLNAYLEIFNKYHVPHKYIELEFTENMLLEDTERLIGVVEKIHEIGFECSMDDFGSGYSSLNVLQDIRVDTLKLDRIFFKNAFEKDQRTNAIVKCVLDMAQKLNMATVAEGIEEWDQVEILKIMGCDFIQGYVYAKPMNLNDFEKLLFKQED